MIELVMVLKMVPMNESQTVRLMVSLKAPLIERLLDL
jgi:hypothetical protein